MGQSANFPYKIENIYRELTLRTYSSTHLIEPFADSDIYLFTFDACFARLILWQYRELQHERSRIASNQT